MVRKVTSVRHRGWYDTHTLIPQVLRINLFITLDYVLQKKSTGVDPHYLDVWAPAHEGVAVTAEKLVSNNFTIMRHLLYPIELNILQEHYTEELRKIHRHELEDPGSVPFNVDAAYAAGGGTPHGRYVKVSIVFRSLSSVCNT
jgi:hypothetical protein